MRPDPDRVLRGVAMALMAEVAPQVGTAFGQGTTRMAGMLAMYTAAIVDGLADRLMVENRGLVDLLGSAAGVVDDPKLADRLRAVSMDRDVPDLKVSTLLAVNDRLRALLTELHQAVETQTGPEAAELDEQIWQELIESTRRRHVDLMG